MNHVGTIALETARLLLRQYKIADADDMFRNWVTDPEASRFWSWKPHESIEETKSLLTRWIDEYANPEAYHWVIVHKEAAQAIGYIYLNEIKDNDSSASVHFLLSRKYWNQGLATEACTCVLHFAFSTLGAERVHTHHHIGNPASGSVLVKSGMRYVNTEYRSYPEYERISGDYCFYEMLRCDWAKHQAPLP